MMAAAMRLNLRHLWLLVLAAVTVSLVAIAWNVPWSALWVELTRAQPGWLVVALVANLAVYPLWVWQWRLLANGQASVPWRRMTEIVTLYSLANNTLVKVAGLASAGLLLVGRGKLSSSGASSVLLLDQLLVGLMKIGLIVLLLTLAPLPPEALLGLAGFGAIVVALAATVGILMMRPSALARLGASSNGMPGRIAAWLSDVSLSLRAMRQPGRLALVLALAVAKKAAEVLAAYAILAACGAEPSWIAALMVVAAVGITTAVPVVPGSFGVYSATVYAVYLYLGLPPGPALAAGLLQHAVELLPALVLGYGTLLFSRRRAAS